MISVILRSKVTEMIRMGDETEDIKAIKWFQSRAESGFSFLFGRNAKC